MKKALKKVATVLGMIYGYAIMICLFAGGSTFFGFMGALIIGAFGNVALAETICTVIYKQIFPVIIYVSTVTVLLGIVKMYLSGETALTIAKKKEKAKAKKEAKQKRKKSNTRQP